MKKKIYRILSIGTISAALLLNGCTVDTMASNIEMEYLSKYNTNDTIYLGDKPIEIPKYTQEQEEEFRGVWVSTVFNLDFPSRKGLTEAEYKAEYTELLDNLEALNMNAVIFQVRSKSDTFYESKINPWSEFLTGTQGVSPKWDPLEWMIEETHNRGMEFHAWFNPYRVTTGNEELEALAVDNWARKHPQYVISFEGKLQLNPGEPEVIKYINDSVMEVVENYDIDGVHFDDYFYPFRNVKEKWYGKEEENTFKKYGEDFKNVDDWRRDNVDKLIEGLHNSISEYNKNNKRSVQFGISPFGIWGHKEIHPEGSLTPITSRASYDDQFADTRKWVKNNWIDYIAPQVYWTFDEKAAPYGELVNWWADVVKATNVHLYIGHANYRKADTNNKNISWQNPKEISNQLKFNSLYDEVKGSIFFRYKSLLEDEKNPKANNEFLQTLKKEHFKNIALLPSKPWLSHGEVKSPSDISIVKANNGNVVIWKDSAESGSSYYIICRKEIKDGVDSSNQIIGKIIREGKGTQFAYFDKDSIFSKEYEYSVIGVDRANNKSIPNK